MTTPERSVEEIVSTFMSTWFRPAYFEVWTPATRQEQVLHDEAKLKWETCKKQLTQTLKAERQKREEVVEAERERWMKAVKFLHSDLKQDGMYDGKVSSDFISGWKDALQWLATSMHPNQIVSKDLEITHPNNPKT